MTFLHFKIDDFDVTRPEYIVQLARELARLVMYVLFVEHALELVVVVSHASLSLRCCLSRSATECCSRCLWFVTVDTLVVL